MSRGGASCAGRNANDAVEPGVAGVAGLEERRGAHVVQGGIHFFSSGEFFQDLGGAVAVAPVSHVNQGSIGGLERIAGIQVGDAVGADHLPVGAAGEHAPRQALAGEAPAGDADDAPPPLRRGAELLGRGERDLSLEEGLEIQSL